MNKLGKAVLIAGGMAVVGCVSYLKCLTDVIVDLDESSETAYNIYSYDVQKRPTNGVFDVLMKNAINANEIVKQWV